MPLIRSSCSASKVLGSNPVRSLGLSFAPNNAPAQAVKPLVIACAMLPLLSACGSNTASAPTLGGSQNASVTTCVDNNLNARCDASEPSQKGGLGLAPNLRSGDLLKVDAQGWLSAPQGSSVVTPFTTLMQNEVLFNPRSAFESTPESALSKAIESLKLSFPGYDFEALRHREGPSEQSQELRQSFNQAVATYPAAPYCAVSAAIEAMINSRSFSVSISAKDAEDTCFTTLAFRQLSSAAGSTLTDLTVDAKGNYLVASTADNKLRVWEAGSAETDSTLSALSSESLMSAMDDDDEDEDDEDDDDDDDHDGESGASEVTNPDWNGKPIDPVLNTKITNMSQVLASSLSRSAYLVSKPSFTFSQPQSACDGGTSYGVYKVNLALFDQVANSASKAFESGEDERVPAPELRFVRAKDVEIDAISAASTPNFPPPQTPGPVPDPDLGDGLKQEASCKSSYVESIALSHDERVLLMAQKRAVYRLDPIKLEPSGDVFRLYNNAAHISHVSLSRDGNRALVSSSENNGLTIVNAMSLRATGWLFASPQIAPLAQAEFINKDRQAVAYSQDGSELLIFDVSSRSYPVLQQRIDLGDKIKHLAVVSDQDYFAVQTENGQLFSYDSASLTLRNQLPAISRDSDKLLALDDQLVQVDNSKPGIRRWYYGTVFGSELTLANQLLSDELVLASNRDTTNIKHALNLPKQFTAIPNVSISWQYQGDNSAATVDTDSGAVTLAAQPSRGLLSATLRGSFRGEALSMQRFWPVVLNP